MFRRRYTMLETRFGVEIEMTGITRKKAAETLAGFFWTEAKYAGTYYETYTVKDRNSRTWKLIRDGSIRCQLTNKRGRRDFTAADRYSMEGRTVHIQHTETKHRQLDPRIDKGSVNHREPFRQDTGIAPLVVYLMNKMYNKTYFYLIWRFL